MKRNPEDLILGFYRGKRPRQKMPVPDLGGCGLTNFALGLGDTVILTTVPVVANRNRKFVPVYSASSYYRALKKFNPMLSETCVTKYVNVFELYAFHDCGPGHITQRLCRAFGLPIPLIPGGALKIDKPKKVKNRVIMHFEPGGHAEWQRKEIKPNARQIYPQTKKSLEKLIRDHPTWEFIEVGNKGIDLKGATFKRPHDTESLVRLLASAELFIGIMSGPCHVATALGLRCIQIVNIMPPNEIFLPSLVDMGRTEEEWYYPQNVLLHQDGSGPLVPKVSLRTLEQAINGEVYPYWSHKYLDLIYATL